MYDTKCAWNGRQIWSATGMGGGGGSFFEDVPSVKFLSFVFTHIPDESYYR